MLGLFFLVVWVTVIAALTSTERQRTARLLLAGQVEEEYRQALAKNDHAALVRFYLMALQRGLPPAEEQLVRINLACAYNGLKRYRQALEELDRVVLFHLLPTQVALWLNNRAYTLILLGRPVDALDHLGDAEELLEGDDGLVHDPSLLACISGTRGIALYHQGEYGPAEQALEQALRLEEASFARGYRDDPAPHPARTAERWWWLGEIAMARGDAEEARVRLARAAAHPTTEFGARALTTLQKRGLLLAHAG